MRSTDVAPSRIAAARAAASAFLARVPRRVQVGAIAFGTAARVIQGPTTDRRAVRSALSAVTPKGTTGTGDALALALPVARRPVAPGATPPPAAIVLLSDGKWDNGRDPIAVARTAARDHVPIYAVSLGTANGTITRTNRRGRTRTIHVPPDPQAMRQIASASKAQAFDVHDATRLTAVYRRLGSQLTHRKAQRQITSGVAGGALALVVIAGSLSLLWFGRLP
jgi:Ca-activated chloride channel family protein